MYTLSTERDLRIAVLIHIGGCGRGINWHDAISRPMVCPWWFRWAVGHNAAYQGKLKTLRDRGLSSDSTSEIAEGGGARNAKR